MQNLGTLSGDFASLAIGINDGGEVVGVSVDGNFNVRAFLWEKGVMHDLNALIASNPSGLKLQVASSINSSGEIIGVAQTGVGETHGFLATPHLENYRSLAYSAWACLRIGMSESASFQRVRKSW